MTRVAAVDCGTNSIRLLIAEVEPEPAGGGAGALRELDRRMTIVRLGQGVDRTGRLAPEALERTFAACRDFAARIEERGGVDQLRFVATSATRDAANRDDFVRGVVDILGVEPEVITGDEEAALSFLGATASRPAEGGGWEAPYLVVDIGGGSTEFVLGEERARAARSVDIGCVRLTERHLVREGRLSDPPPPEALAAIRKDIEAALDTAAETVPLRQAATLVGLAGSVTTVAGIALGLDTYDPAAIHHARISREQVDEVVGRLVRSGHAERAAIPVMHPGRVDVIVAGSMVLQAVMERSGAAEVLVSEHDILDGIALSAGRRAH